VKARVFAAVGTLALAALVNIATGELTQHWAVAWWAATAALVVVGGALQAWLTVSERPRRQSIQNVVATGSIGQHMSADGEQTITDAHATDVTQRQGPQP
jgi:hypothetical protein